MYLGEDISYYRENCKDDTMIHFDEYTKILDVTKLRYMEDDHHQKNLSKYYNPLKRIKSLTNAVRTQDKFLLSRDHSQ